MITEYGVAELRGRDRPRARAARSPRSRTPTSATSCGPRAELIVVSDAARRAHERALVVRHAETEWSASGRHTSRPMSRSPTRAGRAAARSRPCSRAHEFALVLASPTDRGARHRGRWPGFADAVVDDDLREWDYGELEGLTTAEIRARGAEWSAVDDLARSGAGRRDARTRSRPAPTAVLDRVAAAGGDVLCFAHGHILRVLVAVALGLDPAAGARFALEPAMVSIIGAEHGEPALFALNRGS